MTRTIGDLGWKLIAVPGCVVALLAGCAGMAGTPDYRAIVASPDRSDADRKTDVRRRPEQLLAFSGVKTGMKVLDIGAGGGYSSELLARAVGPTGVVYAQNSQEMIDKFVKTAFDDRAQKPAMKNVVKVVRDFDDPAPATARDLDLVTVYLIYHDTTYMNVDRAEMNQRLFEALKPGGHLVVIDHSAQPGADVSVGKSLHRIDEALLRREVEAAGFKLVAEGDFLRNPADSRDAPFFKMQMPTDRFALKFVRP
jgi:predicted methyltransferase